ncbi:FMN-dependent dehydrogenase [Actinomyces sp.]|uniref:FMN-dependent dehydrogenase n=1 Tax=Actinomyces sp. TaxID=29317 RepID=UPI0026DB089A|nr:FMN-dependent dehydrogenase [Actinomyces sp.]MDO4900247.1 FMN-dependent dehydrogenase [Actinomyces sp.]
MPSYRSHLTVTELLPGKEPREVEAAARTAVTALTTLEAFQVDVRRGRPCVTVRFTGVDDSEARAVHRRILVGLHQVAMVEERVLAKVVGGRSLPIAAAD